MQRDLKTPTLRERLRESTNAAILDSAEKVASRQGLREASLQAIAQDAGIAVGTIYNYFQDRTRLFEGLFARRREELSGAIDRAAKEHAGAGFEAELAAFVTTVLTFFDERRVYLRIAIESDEARPAMVKGSDGKRRPAMQQMLHHAERIVRLGVKDKKVRDEKRTHLQARVLVSILRGFLLDHLDDDESLAAESDHVIALFLHGVAR